MVKILVNLDEESDKFVRGYMVKKDLKNKSEAIREIINDFSKLYRGKL